MMKKLTALLLFIGFFCTAFGNTFIVTTNADSGTGSLREAITLANANGISESDTIHFNISIIEYNDRLIRLITELPALTSNILIDGTSQPGETYGTTDAKICLVKTDYAAEFSMLRIENANNVQIYGLHLYYGYWEGLFSQPLRSNKLYGISLSGTTNINIGAPDKGNVINGVVHGIYSSSEVNKNIIIRSNYLGHSGFYAGAQDIDQAVLSSECAITLGSVKDITIGGPDPLDGNIFGSPRRAINIDSKNNVDNGTVLIQQNLFGYAYNKTEVIPNISDFWDHYIQFGRSRNNPVNWSLEHAIDYQIFFMDNQVEAGLAFYKVSGLMTILRNRFEYSENFLGGFGLKLKISACPGSAIVGTESETDANYFLNKKDNDNEYGAVSVISGGPVTFGKNVFVCNSTYGSVTNVDNHPNIPFIQVDKTTPAQVSGRAEAGAKIDLYYDDECTACEGKKFLATVQADGNGIWKYDGPIGGTVVAIATNASGYSSEFSHPTYDETKVEIIHSTCGKNNASIKGLTTEGAQTYFWIHQATGDTASRSLDLENVGPGYYILHGVHGGTCVSRLFSTSIEDRTPKIYSDYTTLLHPSCGQANGSIVGTLLYGSNTANFENSIIKWINSKGETVGIQQNIHNLYQDSYRFVVLDTISGCSDTASFTLKNISGPELLTAEIKITPANCSEKNGKIEGLSVSGGMGNRFMQWLDSLNNPVGNALDLKNLSPGKYRLKFKDESACDTITTEYFLVPNQGAINIDTSGKNITASKCSGASGKIEQINVTGGDTFKWINKADNSVAGSSLNINNLAPGDYQLTVINQTGCSKQSPVITVPQAVARNPNVLTGILKDAVCGDKNGFIELQLTKDSADYTFRWVDSLSGETVGNNPSLRNLGEGRYFFYSTDSYDCEQKLYSAQIKEFPAPVLDYSNLRIQKDPCGLGQGSIFGVSVIGLRGQAQFTWFDDRNTMTGNGRDLPQAAAGSYVLKVADADACTVLSRPLVVADTVSALAPPLYEHLIIPRFADAVITARNPESGTYSLYADESLSVIIQQNNSGTFSIPKIENEKSFYVQMRSGGCSSPAVKINIQVVDKSYFSIPNAFTPNGDGLNDVLPVKVIGMIDLAYFKIYNQWGQQVFETRRLNDGWDGFRKGTLQNAGVYVWVAVGKTIDGKIINEKGSFVLIR